MRACLVHVTGIVQGVGFRPHVWGLADRLALRGWVRNSSSGVDISIEGAADDVGRFLAALREGAPPLARIDDVAVEDIAPAGRERFEIVSSKREEDAPVAISPDVATCAACLGEMADPGDRRHRYPFINCTDCGPRFTIIRDVPYDRPLTTMAGFEMCAACRAEYEDPADRRFHAQPVACPACGPHLRLEADGRAFAVRDEALREARRRIAAGEIVAVKGLGGFHLAVDATSASAVTRLRQRKHREEKPFALMARDEAVVERHAHVSEAARRFLESPARPVILLPAREGSGVAPGVAPGRSEHGFMLPYTPLHHLLLEDGDGFPDVLVMTSANHTDEPIVYLDEEAPVRLDGIADAYLLHDRPIHMRTDDSVAAERRGRAYFFRRSRGYAPRPVPLPFETGRVLAVGGELKNAFRLVRGDRAFLSHHIGDLDYLENWRALESGLEHYERLFRIRPGLIAYDLHPDYRATRYALDRAERESLPAIGVQHHHAHIVSCMADNGLPPEERVIGVSFDGTGYGPDGAIWGGEFLVAGYADYTRALHLDYCPLPGGDAAVRCPYRTALSWLRRAGLDWAPDLDPVREAGEDELALLDTQLRAGVNTPATSSAGRLFDAAASLAGVRQRITYEAQAASEFEAVAVAIAAGASGASGAYPFGLDGEIVDPAPAIRALVEDVRRGTETSVVSARFHNGLAILVRDACRRLRDEHGLGRVALSGGVWQNRFLLHRAVDELEGEKFEVLVHHQVPANDGGLALGQAMAAAARMRAREAASG